MTRVLVFGTFDILHPELDTVQPVVYTSAI